MYMLQWLFTTGKLMKIVIKGHFYLRKRDTFFRSRNQDLPLFRGHISNQNVTDQKEVGFFKCVLITVMEAFTNRTISLKLM